jgi:hypothetical protein
MGEDIVTLRQGLRTVEVSLVVLESARRGVTMEVGPPGAGGASGGGGRHGQGDGMLHVG